MVTAPWEETRSDARHYTIWVRGRLDQIWVSQMDGMRVRCGRDAASEPVTVLQGTLPDQSALSGILNLLLDLRLHLLSLTSAPAEDAQAAEPD